MVWNWQSFSNGCHFWHVILQPSQKMKRAAPNEPIQVEDTMDIDKKLPEFSFAPPVQKVTNREKLTTMHSMLGSPPTTDPSPLQLLTVINQQLAKNPDKFERGTSLWQRRLTTSELKQLEEINQSLAAEYQLRKSMLLKRLDATKLAFQMAPELHDQEVMDKLNEDIERILLDGSACDAPEFNILDLQLVDASLLQEPTISKSLPDKHSAVRSFLMNAQVPDRGGRVNGEKIERPQQQSIPGFKERTGAEHDPTNLPPLQSSAKKDNESNKTEVTTPETAAQTQPSQGGGRGRGRGKKKRVQGQNWNKEAGQDKEEGTGEKGSDAKPSGRGRGGRGRGRGA